MTDTVLADDEAARLRTLRALQLLDTPPERHFDLIAECARAAANTRWAMVSLVDQDRQWFKAGLDFPLSQTDRSASFCTHVVALRQPLTITDARLDPRFAASSLVIGAPGVRAYAGAPIIVEDHTIGAVCAVDDRPRPFSASARRQIQLCAELVAEILEQFRRKSFLAQLFEGTADAVLAVDTDQRITHWNAASEALFGFDAQEAIGQQLRMIIPDRFRAAHDEGFNRLCQTGQARRGATVEVPALRRDGTEFQADLSVSVCRDGPSALVGAIIRDVSDRHALAQARSANLAKSRFLANMSHEIRTPLNGILGLGHVLARTDLAPEQRALLDTINGAASTLQALLTDVLDLARIDDGALPVTHEPFDLAQMVADVAALHQAGAEAKGLGYICQPPPETWVRGDALRLRQVLGNLLSNAVKFTAEGEVRLSVHAEGDLWCFEVADTGIGFDAAIAERIFERFVQGDDSVTRAYGGSGLGLSISREIAQALGGQLMAAGAPGEGAVFTARVPLQACAPPQQDHEAAPQRTYLGRILLAEDHPVNRQVVEMILAPLGVELDAVENGSLAVEAARSKTYSLILMDMQMPVMDGLTATRRIREDEQLTGRPRCPVIMLTANVLPEHLFASFQAGADQHLGKPVDAATLIGAVADLLVQADVAGQAAAS